jgi:hypothetical protein
MKFQLINFNDSVLKFGITDGNGAVLDNGYAQHQAERIIRKCNEVAGCFKGLAGLELSIFKLVSEAEPLI